MSETFLCKTCRKPLNYTRVVGLLLVDVLIQPCGECKDAAWQEGYDTGYDDAELEWLATDDDEWEDDE